MSGEEDIIEPIAESEPESEPDKKIDWENLPDTDCHDDKKRMFDTMLCVIGDEKGLTRDEVKESLALVADVWANCSSWKKIAVWCISHMECEADLIEELFPSPVETCS